MSEITTPQPEKDLTRVDTMGDPTDSRTASESGGVVSNGLDRPSASTGSTAAQVSADSRIRTEVR